MPAKVAARTSAVFPRRCSEPFDKYSLCNRALSQLLILDKQVTNNALKRLNAPV
jgi:hypothetical protein